jgi:hypothetical protein
MRAIGAAQNIEVRPAEGEATDRSGRRRQRKNRAHASQTWIPHARRHIEAAVFKEEDSKTRICIGVACVSLSIWNA